MMEGMNQKMEDAVQHKIEQIIIAASKFQDEPERAEEYIRRTVKNIWTTGKEFGKQLQIDDIFNPNMN